MVGFWGPFLAAQETGKDEVFVFFSKKTEKPYKVCDFFEKNWYRYVKLCIEI